MFQVKVKDLNEIHIYVIWRSSENEFGLRWIDMIQNVYGPGGFISLYMSHKLALKFVAWIEGCLHFCKGRLNVIQIHFIGF